MPLYALALQGETYSRDGTHLSVKPVLQDAVRLFSNSPDLAGSRSLIDLRNLLSDPVLDNRERCSVRALPACGVYAATGSRMVGDVAGDLEAELVVHVAADRERVGSRCARSQVLD